MVRPVHGWAGIKPAVFTWEVALASSLLPGTLHSDPADRLLIATARRLGAPIVTRDSKIPI
ncbi:MAG: PIN domain-containing protein, partial [Caulobacteraceae bacterium]